MTTVQYLTKIRMDQAVHLLRTTQLSVEKIASRIGYASSSYFCRVFRGILGVTPHQFRSNEEWSHDQKIAQSPLSSSHNNRWSNGVLCDTISCDNENQYHIGGSSS